MSHLLEHSGPEGTDYESDYFNDNHNLYSDDGHGGEGRQQRGQSHNNDKNRRTKHIQRGQGRNNNNKNIRNSNNNKKNKNKNNNNNNNNNIINNSSNNNNNNSSNRGRNRRSKPQQRKRRRIESPHPAGDNKKNLNNDYHPSGNDSGSDHARGRGRHGEQVEIPNFLEDAAAAWANEVHRLREEFETERREETKRLREDLNILNCQLSDAKINAEKAHSNQAAVLAATNAFHTNEIQQLQNQINSAKGLYALGVQDLVSMTNCEIALREELTDKIKELSQKNLELAAKDAELAAKDVDLATKEAELQTLASALNTVRASEQATWDECRLALEKQLVQAQQAYEQSQQRTGALELQAVADDLASTSRIQDLAGEIEALRGCVAKLLHAGNLRPDKEGLDYQAAEAAVLAAEADLVVREQRRLRSQFCSLRANSLAHKTEKGELKREKDEFKRENDRFKRENDRFKRENDKLNREKDDLLGRVASAQEENRQERCRRLDAENRDDCMLCMERPRTVVFQPCMHLVNCKECSVGCKQCPYCQVKVKKMLEVYRP